MTCRRARVRIPCSTSNLGAGFDCLGLAFQRYLTVELSPADDLPKGDDLITRTLIAELHRLKKALPACSLRVESDIPIKRGLGSSAAATVGGLLLARAIAGELNPDRTELLQIAATREGHPDNVAPALWGGLVAIARDEAQRFHAFRLPLSEQIGFAFAAPDAEVSTPEARKALPERIEFAAAIRTAGRMAALVHGLATADSTLLQIGMSDELHVPFRLPLIPGANDAFRAARDAGAWAATISGSGSGLIAVCARGREAGVADAMATALQASGDRSQATAFAAAPDLTGATTELES